jgi:uncharacterized protein YjbJ (UPF0337 family)
MDKNRIAGSAKQIKGSIKVALGKVAGDAKLEAEGKADRAKGKMQNAVGDGTQPCPLPRRARLPNTMSRQPSSMGPDAEGCGGSA